MNLENDSTKFIRNFNFHSAKILLLSEQMTNPIMVTPYHLGAQIDTNNMSKWENGICVSQVY